MRSFCDIRACELNTTDIPLQNECLRPSYQAIKCGKSPVYPISLLLVSAIVDFVEAESRFSSV